ncbi:RNA-binding protein 39 [Pyrus ussuriensis x Pyrus communis]|uniref:RNA-binding protein 39 n=1 Tax=Pyrus ussuriensis x Pyrus communis TaxID=2448454 RepID=A0A5N5IAW4_9ROSA|nr:RNA-binding protein 39 [Pyrus ussuriensis x Pyrus communis]
MDFDEYDYLEKTVENPEPPKSKETANGGEETLKSGEKGRSRSSKHKGDEKGHDEERHSKRSKSGDESRERDNDRHRERGSSHHRSQSRDREKDRHRSSRDHRGREDREREERNGKERDRERDKERDPGRDRDRRERDREGDRDREKEKERSRRSRSHSERHRSDRDERERSREVEHKERDKEKDLREREKENRRHKDKKEEGTEPEADPERDQRTVFAYQICLKADERDVYEFFSRAGKVRDVRLIMDRNSRRSKGVGYIEFYDAMSVPMAIALSGQPLLGQPVMVKPSEAEKNLVQSTTSVVTGPGGMIGPYSGGARRLYVGNLHSNIKEDDLRQVFGAFGPVELVQLPLDETNNCKGFGFVQFARLEDARNSLSLNGQLEIAGRVIKVSAVTDQAGMQDLGANAGDFDDDEGGGLALNARSRAMLMQKLDRSGTAPSIAGPLGTPAVNSAGVSLPMAPILGAAPVVCSLVPPIASIPGFAGLGVAGLQIPAATLPSVDTIGVPSECLLLKNMFDPTAESEPNFDLDIKDDVQEECSKYGTLKHIYVDKNTAGHVYLRFENTQAAISARHVLHGRWFAGKMIEATFMLPQTYEAKFPESR